MFLVLVESEMVVRTPKIKVETDDSKTHLENSLDATNNNDEKRHGFLDCFRKLHKDMFSIDVFLDAIDPSKLHNNEAIVSNYF